MDHWILYSTSSLVIYVLCQYQWNGYKLIKTMFDWKITKTFIDLLLNLFGLTLHIYHCGFRSVGLQLMIIFFVTGLSDERQKSKYTILLVYISIERGGYAEMSCENRTATRWCLSTWFILLAQRARFGIIIKCIINDESTTKYIFFF